MYLSWKKNDLFFIIWDDTDKVSFSVTLGLSGVAKNYDYLTTLIYSANKFENEGLVRPRLQLLVTPGQYFYANNKVVKSS